MKKATALLLLAGLLACREPLSTPAQLRRFDQAWARRYRQRLEREQRQLAREFRRQQRHPLAPSEADTLPQPQPLNIFHQ